MNEAYAVLWSRDAAAEALNERRIELNLSLIELDEAARQAPGTAAKYLGPGGLKSLGVGSLFKLAGALGLRVVLEVDPVATANTLAESRSRNAAQARPDNFSQKCGKRTLTRALNHLAALDWNEALRAVAEARAAAKVVKPTGSVRTTTDGKRQPTRHAA